MRIVDIFHRSVPISRYPASIPVAPNLDTTIVAIVADERRGGRPLIGYGFTSFGRYGQSGLIRERFAPRLASAPAEQLMAEDERSLDPSKALLAMMVGEKPGGHGERCVAVGAIDMALWDLAAKARDMPLWLLLKERFGTKEGEGEVPIYASGGYLFPDGDLRRLRAEAEWLRASGFQTMKMKIGASPLAADLKRIETVLDVFGDGSSLAVDAMNVYAPEKVLEVAEQLQALNLKWFEDICDPLDFETHQRLTERYAPPISAGEALFSYSDARNLLRYAGFRPGHDVLTFDPAHCDGIDEYVRIIRLFQAVGWTKKAFLPHGGHLFSLHVAAGLGLGGCECNPLSFQPFGGFSDDAILEEGRARPPSAPGIGFETRRQLMDVLSSLG